MSELHCEACGRPLKQTAITERELRAEWEKLSSAGRWKMLVDARVYVAGIDTRIPEGPGEWEELLFAERNGLIAHRLGRVVLS